MSSSVDWLTRFVVGDNPSHLLHDTWRAFRFGALFGLTACVLISLLRILADNSVTDVARTAPTIAFWGAVIGAAGAFRTPIPTWPRVRRAAWSFGLLAVAVAAGAVSGAAFPAWSSNPLPDLAFFAILVLLPVGVWQLLGWKAGVLMVGLLWIRLLIVFS